MRHFSRPVSRQYSKYPLNGVGYTYNAAGQVSAIQDGSGIQYFSYDALGNVSKNVRTFAVPYSGHTYTFTMEYEYDSWGRMLAMTYPDGERVSYSYDHGGNLFSMSGVKNSVPYRYVNSVIYDRYGNRSRIEHGNLSHTEYSYDDLQRLTRLRTYAHNSGNEALIQDIAYTFDNVGNITGAGNSASAFGTLGGTYSNSYSYDVIDRLTGAVQSYGSGNTLMADYSSSGRLCSRSQTFSGQASIFGYCNNSKPHAPRRVLDNGNMTLHDIMWDMNGNMAMVNEYVIGEEKVQSSRCLFWTEDNRLASVVDEKNLSYYAYDHSGGSCGSREQSQACLSYAEMEQRRQCQRVLKLTGKNTLIDVNAEMVNYYSLVGDVTLYTSPYLVANNSGYTKHYYAGSERICARLGNGSLNYHQTQAQPFIGNNAALEVNSQALFSSVMGSMSDRGLTDNSQLTIRALCNNGSDPLSVQLKPVPMKVGVATAFTTDLFDDAMGQYAIQTQQNESPYFYHSDHLGSASWITDASGIPVQHLQLYYHARFSSTRSTGACTTFGEPFVNQHTSGYQRSTTKDGAATHKAPLRGPLDLVPFTGKERDAETGYSYFGARYYDSDLSGLFLSVDPMADKYPSISPYAYCMWNPVKLVDPNGMDTIVTIGLSNGNVEYWYDDNSYNGTFVDLMNDDNQTSRYRCTGSVSLTEESNIGRTTVPFSKDKDAYEVFDRITGCNELNVESDVEWNYYQQKNGTGDLVTSHKKDEINVTGLEKEYNIRKTQSFHHFHPSTSSSAPWIPSPEDQNYSKTLGIPCFLHFNKQNYQFDDIVRTYGVMDYYQFQGYVPITIIK